MNTTIINPVVIGGTEYIEKVCSSYVNDINTLVIKVVILNFIYFLFLKNLFYKIGIVDLGILRLRPYKILDGLVFLSNYFIFAYYIIFRFNDLVISNIDFIWLIVKTFIIISIIIIGLKYRKKIKEFIKENFKNEEDN